MADIIDLSRYPSKSQQNIQVIRGILQSLGQGEAVRRKRQELDLTSQLLTQDTELPQIIQSLVSRKPEFSPGAAGILQRIGGLGIPAGGATVVPQLQQSLLQERLKKAGRVGETETLKYRDKKGVMRIRKVGTENFNTLAEQVIDKGGTLDVAGKTVDEKIEQWTKIAERAAGPNYGLFEGSEPLSPKTYEQAQIQLEKLWKEKGVEQPTAEVGKTEPAKGPSLTALEQIYAEEPEREGEIGAKDRMDLIGLSERLDPESLAQLKQIVNEGDIKKIKQAIQRMRDIYGDVR